MNSTCVSIWPDDPGNVPGGGAHWRRSPRSVQYIQILQPAPRVEQHHGVLGLEESGGAKFAVGHQASRPFRRSEDALVLCPVPRRLHNLRIGGADRSALTLFE